MSCPVDCPNANWLERRPLVPILTAGKPCSSSKYSWYSQFSLVGHLPPFFLRIFRFGEVNVPQILIMIPDWKFLQILITVMIYTDTDTDTAQTSIPVTIPILILVWDWYPNLYQVGKGIGIGTIPLLYSYIYLYRYCSNIHTNTDTDNTQWGLCNKLFC